MRPSRLFLFLLIFISFFIGLHYIVPGNRLFPSASFFLPPEIESGIKAGNPLTVKPEGTPKESLSITNKFSELSSKYLLADTGKSDQAALGGFIDSLSKATRQIRVMYYGDSQLEGDRITFWLRRKLREEIGGTGPGLFQPLMNVMYTKSLWISSSSNWKRYNYLSYKSGTISNTDLGPFISLCRFLPEGVRSEIPEIASVRIKPSAMADRASRRYDNLRIFYGNAHDSVIVRVKEGDALIYSDLLKQGRGFFESACKLHGNEDVKIEFEGRVSPDIYGISIESSSGVILDNIPLRGSAGLEFTMAGRENLREAFNKLRPDLFILQYGLNVVKNVTMDYSYYQKGLERQILLLKELSPSTPVLIVGVTDMAGSDSAGIRSYRNIPDLIRAQKKAALRTGAAFWDAHDAMGGESSVIRWAKLKPPLAQKDFVHLTYDGADSLSKLLAKAILPPDKGTDSLNNLSIVRQDSLTKTAELPAANNSERESGNNIIIRVLKSVFRFTPDEPMIFSVPGFWIFFLFVLLGFSLVWKRIFLRNLYLLIMSLFFYYKSGGLFLFLLILVTVVDFSCGLLIHRSKGKQGRRFFILVSLISNLGILAYFKYTAFFASIINKVLGTNLQIHDFLASLSNSYLGTSFNVSYILLPVGISFFTFQSLSYTIDIYRRKLEPVKNILDFGFYVSFFPQLVAGPIVRASEFIPQLYSEFRLSKQEFNHALFLITKGLIKKIIISDFIAISLIDRVFDAPSLYSGFENLMAIYGYGLQIYCDFSGYTDIAIGLGLVLGFRLPANFNSPYKASGIADFWRRWHISLSRWLKDYLYISLGGNRKGKIRTNLNLMVTMLLGGLWHGTDLRFIIWGALHGFGLVINKIWDSITGGRISGRFGKAVSIFITFQFVSFCWIFFRATNTRSAVTMLRQVFTDFSPLSYGPVIETFGTSFLLILTGYMIHFLPENVKESFRGIFIKISAPVRLALIMIVAILLYQMRLPMVTPFIYFRF